MAERGHGGPIHAGGGRVTVGLRLQAWAGALWRVALAALFGVLTWQAYNLRHLPDWAQRQIQREGDNTRTAALTAIGDTRKEVLGEVATLRADVMTRTDNALATVADVAQRADDRLADLTAKVDDQLTATNATVAGLRADLKPTLDHAAELSGQVNEAAKPLLNCKGNGACLPSQALALVGSARFTMGQIARAAPASTKAIVDLEQQSAGIATDIHKVTTAITAPVPWWKKLGRFLYGGAMVSSKF
ncbi:hypothetical protein [uncultured Paludibaculum sp.]|uniref:hypothetical protein n=1 Tax=uncultured Paludibaculum sp. TaxID=1765020 RepID=UPI002AAB0EA8|nr:hypothetical protein [uncultured Paludibaculum sp.]